MAETVNVEDHSREELNTMATALGLASAEEYPNKPAVADAINRVNAGEDAAAVDAKLAPSTAGNFLIMFQHSLAGVEAFQTAPAHSGA